MSTLVEVLPSIPGVLHLCESRRIPRAVFRDVPRREQARHKEAFPCRVRVRHQEVEAPQHAQQGRAVLREVLRAPDVLLQEFPAQLTPRPQALRGDRVLAHDPRHVQNLKSSGDVLLLFPRIF